MKKIILFLLCLSFTSCHIVERIKTRVNQIVGDSSVVEGTQEKNYEPTPPPTMEEDKTIQVSPKERLLSLFEQFNRSPDTNLQALVLQEFTSQKIIFNKQLDSSLKTVLNRSVPNIQQGELLTLQLLVQILPLLEGENKEFLKSILARGFDSAPLALTDLLGKQSEDRSCMLVLMTPPEVESEARQNFLENRWSSLSVAKESPKRSLVSQNFIEICLKVLRSELRMDETSTEDLSILPSQSTP